MLKNMEIEGLLLYRSNLHGEWGDAVGLIHSHLEEGLNSSLLASFPSPYQIEVDFHA